MLVNLDSTVDNPVEPKGGEERDSSTVKSRGKTDHTHVGNVYDDGHNANKLQTEDEEPNGIQENPQPERCRISKCLPPPTMILRRQSNVAHDYRNKGTGDTN